MRRLKESQIKVISVADLSACYYCDIGGRKIQRMRKGKIMSFVWDIFETLWGNSKKHFQVTNDYMCLPYSRDKNIGEASIYVHGS